jgi:hypothetical protein
MFADILRALSRGAGFVVRLAFAVNAIVALLTILPDGTAALIAEFLDSIGDGSEGVRRCPHGVGEAAFRMVLAHVLELRSP